MEYRSTRPWKILTGLLNRPCTSWSPPPVGWYKPNFDAAIFQEDDRAGVGVIIQDNYSLVMASLSQNIQLATSVVEMEAMAAIRAIEVSYEQGFDNIILEGDC